VSDEKPFEPFDPRKVRVVDKRKLTEEAAGETGDASPEQPVPADAS